MTDTRPLIAATEALIESLTFDDTGFAGKGGNGGLISRETIRKADELRIILYHTKKEHDDHAESQDDQSR